MIHFITEDIHSTNLGLRPVEWRSRYGSELRYLFATTGKPAGLEKDVMQYKEPR